MRTEELVVVAGLWLIYTLTQALYLATFIQAK